MKNNISLLFGLLLLTTFTSCESKKQSENSPQPVDYSTITLYKKDLGEVTKTKDPKYYGTVINITYFKDCIAAMHGHFNHVPYKHGLEGPGIRGNEAKLDTLLLSRSTSTL